MQKFGAYHRLSKEILNDLRLTETGWSSQDHPLMLVILKGDFDLSNLPSFGSIPKPNWHRRVSYITYVMELNAGLPTLTVSSPRGGRFRKALNNPNLPDDPPANPALQEELKNRTQALPRPPIVPPANKPPYGTLIR